jgi:membrane protein implicated in regulation of membrane protease activity
MSSTAVIWLIIGASLCLVELVFPTAFIALMMGLSALIVALMAGILTKLWLQTVVWLALSTALVLISRSFFPSPHRSSKFRDATVGETLTEILAGKTGRVIYEGNSWRAKCDDEKLAIASQQQVYIVRREGTTLIVMPENSLH